MLTEIRLIKDEGNHTTMNGLPFLTDASSGAMRRWRRHPWSPMRQTF
jgi:hypothetical protein